MTSTQLAPASKPSQASSQDLNLCCWRCATPLTPLYTAQQQAAHACAHCNALTMLDEGIWRCLTAHDAQHYSRFIAEYEAIREREGRGSSDAAYYLALPHNDLSGRNAAQWKIRAQTFKVIAQSILAPLAQQSKRPLRILDLGAGNGWLSYRLAQSGHRPTAVDLLTNDRDGLGAAAHYAPHIAPMFPRVQASLDRLPFAPSTFDLAIFNASFHYSENYIRTLGEALRCVRPGGLIVLTDSPWYARDESGRSMVAEKHSRFHSTYGFASDSIPSLEYLTPSRLEAIASAWGLRWRTLKPFYGVAWSMRPFKAMLQRRRTPSHFYIHVAEVPA